MLLEEDSVIRKVSVFEGGEKMRMLICMTKNRRMCAGESEQKSVWHKRLAAAPEHGTSSAFPIIHPRKGCLKNKTI